MLQFPLIPQGSDMPDQILLGENWCPDVRFELAETSDPKVWKQAAGNTGQREDYASLYTEDLRQEA